MSSFRIEELIALKRDGFDLTAEQIKHFVERVVAKDIGDSQIGAMLMAMFLRGLNSEETVHLTRAMIDTGELLKWPEEWKGSIGDKHSTGGVGDKVSLPLAPALAVCGVKVPMISGRGLGHTGGTLDKLESIPGYRFGLSPVEMKKSLTDVGCCIAGQTDTLAPADRVLYSLRDITGTVASNPLIASSIMSKKASENLDALVLDVKCGRAAFTAKTPELARIFAVTLYKTCAGLGIKCAALITNMDHPIGLTVGNSVEVAESVRCLNGQGPEDLQELVCAQGGHLLKALNKVDSAEEGFNKIKTSLHNGTALRKFQEMLSAHGVSPDTANALCTPGADPYVVLPLAPQKTELRANKPGIVRDINAMACASVCGRLGAGRQKSTDAVDHSVGLILHVRVGQYVHKGDVWVCVHHKGNLDKEGIECLEKAIMIVESEKTESLPVESRIIEVIDSLSVRKSSLFTSQ
ncbi:predicted protein [Nematostella vectensis]|uniref:Thymidine phosphorylase n=1 Tax=Nematostella vectensis TaxID=45351 RepID=A7RXX2_NEMVE|nr:thymidine phosphorylase [Nematostella vectensis]EDO43698.1 predicted protein [Nematostella vectensis]|eukprot:XP_001635761.1 predicted protein [Nematostella vectensis]